MIHVLIPARANSKAVKNKNIVKIKGQELIGYSIQVAQKLNLVTRIIVSTDSKSIARISTRFGASVPFLRPLKYARDNSPDIQVFKHYISWLKNNNEKIPELIIHLRPTTPFRSVSVINKAIKIIKDNKKISCLRSMRHSSFSPYKMWHINKKGKCYPVLKIKKELHSTARQSLPKAYDHIGYVDILRVKKTVLKNTMVGNYVYPFIIDNKNLNKFIDIDTLNDLYKARKI